MSDTRPGEPACLEDRYALDVVGDELLHEDHGHDSKSDDVDRQEDEYDHSGRGQSQCRVRGEDQSCCSHEAYSGNHCHERLDESNDSDRKSDEGHSEDRGLVVHSDPEDGLVEVLEVHGDREKRDDRDGKSTYGQNDREAASLGVVLSLSLGLVLLPCRRRHGHVRRHVGIHVRIHRRRLVRPVGIVGADALHGLLLVCTDGLFEIGTAVSTGVTLFRIVIAAFSAECDVNPLFYFTADNFLRIYNSPRNL